VAAGRSDDEVRQFIGADWLIYQDLADLELACQHDDSHVKEFDTSCFSGKYITGDVTDDFLARLQQERSDAAKASKRVGSSSLKIVRGV
jgi:amidophosphoribosyltransferase